MEDYAHDGFNKKGSFPCEWLVVENIIRLDELDFSQDAKQKVIKLLENVG